MNASRRVESPSRRSAAFTLAEMLIVIGIITLLAAILVPAVSSVRRTAKRTASQARISAIAAACQHYYNDFRAYPGPLRNDQLAAGNPPKLPPGVKITLPRRNGTPFNFEGGDEVNPQSVTQAENLVLGLMGGLVVTYKQSGSTVDLQSFKYDRAAVGPGPQSLTSIPEQRKSYAPYLSQPNWLYGWASNSATSDLKKGFIGSSNFPCTAIPEFTDADGLPILYLRARVGAPLGNPNQAGISANEDLQYNYNHLLAYSGPVAQTGKGDFKTEVKNGNSLTYKAFGLPEFVNYLKSPNSTNPTPTAQNPWLPRGKDAFILISAGSDGFYGTDDDIIYPQ